MEGSVYLGVLPVTHGTIVNFGVGTVQSAVVTSVVWFGIVARDANGQIATGYAGTVQFLSTDPTAVLPTSTPITNGQGGFVATLGTLGTQGIIAVDTASIATANFASVAMQSVPPVSTNADKYLFVAIPSVGPLNLANYVQVIPGDGFNNVASNYAGTIHFTSSDTAAVMPPDTVWTSTSQTFTVTFKTAGTQTVTATDTVLQYITKTSGNCVVG